MAVCAFAPVSRSRPSIAKDVTLHRKLRRPRLRLMHDLHNVESERTARSYKTVKPASHARYAFWLPYNPASQAQDAGLPAPGKTLRWPNPGKPRVWPGGEHTGLPLD